MTAGWLVVALACAGSVVAHGALVRTVRRAVAEGAALSERAERAWADFVARTSKEMAEWRAALAESRRVQRDLMDPAERWSGRRRAC